MPRAAFYGQADRICLLTHLHAEGVECQAGKDGGCVFSEDASGSCLWFQVGISEQTKHSLLFIRTHVNSTHDTSDTVPSTWCQPAGSSQKPKRETLTPPPPCRMRSLPGGRRAVVGQGCLRRLGGRAPESGSRPPLRLSVYISVTSDFPQASSFKSGRTGREMRQGGERPRETCHRIRAGARGQPAWLVPPPDGRATGWFCRG